MTLAQEGLLKTTRRTMMTCAPSLHSPPIIQLILTTWVFYRNSRNLAFVTTVGVVGGTVLFFNLLKGRQPIAKPDERYAYNGELAGPSGQTDQGPSKPGRVKLKSYNER